MSASASHSMQFWPRFEAPWPSREGALVDVLTYGVETATVRFYDGTLGEVLVDELTPVHHREETL